MAFFNQRFKNYNYSVIYYLFYCDGYRRIYEQKYEEKYGGTNEVPERTYPQAETITDGYPDCHEQIKIHIFLVFHLLSRMSTHYSCILQKRSETSFSFSPYKFCLRIPVWLVLRRHDVTCDEWCWHSTRIKTLEIRLASKLRHSFYWIILKDNEDKRWKKTDLMIYIE